MVMWGRGSSPPVFVSTVYVSIHLASSASAAYRRRHQRHLWPLVSLSRKADWLNRGRHGRAVVSDQRRGNLFLRLWQRQAMAESLRHYADSLYLDSWRRGAANAWV